MHESSKYITKYVDAIKKKALFLKKMYSKSKIQMSILLLTHETTTYIMAGILMLLMYIYDLKTMDCRGQSNIVWDGFEI